MKIFLLISFLYITSITAESVHSRGRTSEDDSEDYMTEKLPEEIEYQSKDIGITRETNVEIKQNYLECVNINSEVYKLVADLNLISSENCETLYRFPPSQITYQVAFKNGSSSEIGIKIELQQSEISSDKATVTITGKVVDGYLNGAHFQSVIVYPALNNVCTSESQITELQSSSASVTFILLPNIGEQNDSESYRSLHLPEAFDCFGNTTIKYNPGLLQTPK